MFPRAFRLLLIFLFLSFFTALVGNNVCLTPVVPSKHLEPGQ